MADMEENVCYLVEEFGRMCRRRNVRMKSKIKWRREVGGRRMNVALGSELLGGEMGKWT